MVQTYVAFGAIYATETKPEASTLALDTLTQAKATTQCANLRDWWFNC